MISLHAAVALLALSAAAPPQIQLLDFYAEWCGPCRSMDPAVRQLQAKKYPLRRVNIDDERDLAARYHIERIPCFVLVVDGQEVDRQQGPTSVEHLAKMCQDASRAVSKRMALLAKAPAGPAAVAPATRAATPAAVPWAPESRSAQDAALIAASVRIRVEDPDGHSCGSGTIIDARDGEALILTCAHLFRDSQGKGRIEVDLFGPTPAAAVPAKLRSFDLTRDVGLVSIRAPGPLMVAHLAPTGYVLRSREIATSVGCSHGELPTIMHSHITSMDKFLGPPNLQVAGQPIEGRSGGGLFNAAGQVIGVCNFADRSDNEGIYAALPSLYGELDHAGLGRLYSHEPEAVAPVNVLVDVESRQPEAAAQPFARLVPVARRETSNGSLPSAERAALEEIRRRVQGGAEVVCTIRDRRDPQGKSEVLSLDKASPAFLQELAALSHREPLQELQPTALEVPGPAKAARPPKALLEWDADRGWMHEEPLTR